MFETLKKEIKVGDNVRIILTTGKEPEGNVIEIGENHILIQNSEGIKQRLFDKLIGGWEILGSPIESESKINIDDKPPNSELVESKESEKNENNSGLKILGKIDLEKIKKKKKPRKRRTFVKSENPESLKKNKEKEDIPVQGKFSSFEDFGRAISDKEKDKIVPANAYIIKFSEERGFGFLRDPFDVEIYFNHKDIIDDELRSRIKGVNQHQNIQVCCSLAKGWKGEKAVGIHFPWTIEKSIQKANLLIESKDYINAKNLADQILKSFPHNLDAESILRLLEEKRRAT